MGPLGTVVGQHLAHHPLGQLGRHQVARQAGDPPGGERANQLLQGQGRGDLLGRVSSLLMMGVAGYWLLT